MNKRLHFAPDLVKLILTGKKTVTWRFWDDKNLTKGDLVDFLESGTEKYFATAKITKVVENKIGELTREDKKGHEVFKNDKEMYKRYSGYYGRKVYSNTTVKIIRFKLISR